jgi:hypothetical protein
MPAATVKVDRSTKRGNPFHQKTMVDARVQSKRIAFGLMATARRVLPFAPQLAVNSGVNLWLAGVH